MGESRRNQKKKKIWDLMQKYAHDNTQNTFIFPGFLSQFQR